MMRYAKILLLVALSVLPWLALARGGQAGTPGGNSVLWHKPKDYDKLWQRMRSCTKDGKTIRVVHLGDSHIKYGFVTAPITSTLQRKYGAGVDVQHWGINGATFQTFGTDEEIQKIVQAQPDLLIVSLGTNDSYTPRFAAEEMRANMQAFFSLIKKALPSLPIILTTPPPCFLATTKRVASSSGKGKKRRMVYQSSTSYIFNKHTRTAASTMKYFAKTEGYGLIDLNEAIGSEQMAKQWLSEGLMHHDRVHYTAAGYNRQGTIIVGVLTDVIDGKI